MARLHPVMLPAGTLHLTPAGYVPQGGFSGFSIARAGCCHFVRPAVPTQHPLGLLVSTRVSHTPSGLGFYSGQVVRTPAGRLVRVR